MGMLEERVNFAGGAVVSYPIRLRSNGIKTSIRVCRVFTFCIWIFELLQFSIFILLCNLKFPVFFSNSRILLHVHWPRLTCLQSSMRWLNFAAISGKPHAQASRLIWPRGRNQAYFEDVAFLI